MEFKYFRGPTDEMKEPDSELENTLEFEITFFEKEPLPDELPENDPLPEYDFINDDNMQKELERQEQKNQEDLEKLLEPRIP